MIFFCQDLVFHFGLRHFPMLVEASQLYLAGLSVCATSSSYDKE
jgi:hypothetical protein